MAFTRALFSVLLIIFASLLALDQVEGETDFSGLQTVKDGSMMNEHQVKAQELHAKMFQAALQEYQLHTNTIADKKVKEGISKALREYHAKTAHLVAENQATKHAALRDSKTTRLTERKSDVTCNTDDQSKSVQYNDKDYATASDKTSFSFGSDNNGQSNNNGQNNNNGGQSSSSDFGYNNPSTAAGQKSSCRAQKVPAYQQMVALFMFAFVIIKWLEEDHI